MVKLIKLGAIAAVVGSGGRVTRLPSRSIGSALAATDKAAPSEMLAPVLETPGPFVSA